VETRSAHCQYIEFTDGQLKLKLGTVPVRSAVQ